MALVEILNVSLAPLNSHWLWGCSIDSPKTGSHSDVYAIDISGWALGRKSRIVAINILDDEGSRSVPLEFSRPDVTKHFPEVGEGERCGFCTKIGVLGMAPESEIHVEAVFEDQSHISLGTIRVGHQAVRSTFQPTLQPILITSLGRTGTTWLMHLLAAHPAIVVQRLYPYETRSASYWIHMLKVLSGPGNHRQSAHPDDFHSNMSWVGHHPAYIEAKLNYPQLKRWFGLTYVERLAAFSQHTIDSFYRQVANTQKQSEAVYFAEKYHPGHIPRLIWELYPRAREIFLVRDFRDMICSMLAFNAKRGYVSFGRKLTNGHDDFVRHTQLAARNLLQEWKRRSEQGYLLHYEEMVLHPQKSLRDLFAYLELDTTPVMIDRMLQGDSENTPVLNRHRTIADPRASIGRWQKDLDPSLQALCQELLGDVLQEFGYMAFEGGNGHHEAGQPVTAGL
jgi:hypothetical protein